MASSGDFNAQTIAEFRKNRGRVGGYFEGAPLLLVHTIGRRTGKERVKPVMYLKDRERYLIFASKGGSDTNPDWYHNLKSHPDVQIEVGDETIDVHAKEVTGAERDTLYARQAALYPAFADYQRRTKRIIPVIALTKRAGGSVRPGEIPGTKQPS
jgi:deazaflavin-dependent oxidoreductase (nitroreductase family)